MPFLPHSPLHTQLKANPEASNQKAIYQIRYFLSTKIFFFTLRNLYDPKGSLFTIS